MNRWPVAAGAACAMLSCAPAFAAPTAAGAPPASAAPVVAAPVASVSEALRERVDQLRYATEGPAPEVAGQRILLLDAVARHYEASGFAPVWTEPARVDALVAAIADLEYDGLRPTDYHLDALQQFRG